MSRKRPATLERMARVVAVLQEDDGLTTSEIFEAVSESMNYSQLQAALRHLVRGGEVIRVFNEDWGQVIHLRDGSEQVWPGAGYLFFVDALAAAS